ncbi:MAG: flavin oxidoreductase [Candidatus Marinimicrobia bacterium]|nr:flavin oxidoreductase [Candidatus Neomarinimicrobiota bacterium]|tara:strand:+ start:3991 stop:4608 length:618 start_codon:yes stop_codon:yes gene_type:complete
MIYKKDYIKNVDRIWRLNFINSVTGIKPANLIGSKSKKGKENLAIFSSVVHLGSNPALLGFVIRPQHKKKSHTYLNIQETQYFTINSITKSFYQKAHLTSSKILESEFDTFNIDKEYIEDFHAPFVKNSPLKIGMRIENLVNLPNGCKFIIGSIELISIIDSHVDSAGKIDLDQSDIVGISGLNSYYSLSFLDYLPYVGNKNKIK